MMKPIAMVFLFSAALMLLAGGIARADVVLNELMADPARDWSPSDGNSTYGSLEDEWIEIYNAGTTPEDVSGWRLRDAVSDSSWRYQFEGILLPGEHRVVYGNESYAWEEASGYPKNGLSMNNSGDTMTLVAADLLTIVDQISYATLQVLDDRSYGRLPDGGLLWDIFDGLNPLNPPATNLPPTPGLANVGSPVEQASWARIKAFYR
jgi:hypothetical protein